MERNGLEYTLHVVGVRGASGAPMHAVYAALADGAWILGGMARTRAAATALALRYARERDARRTVRS